MQAKRTPWKKRGLAIEYGLFAILLVTTMVIMLLVTSISMTKKVALRREYIERKDYLDECAARYIHEVEGKILNESALEKEFNQNSFNVEFHVGEYELSAVLGREVILYVFFEKGDDGEYKLTSYRYLYQYS